MSERPGRVEQQFSRFCAVRGAEDRRLWSVIVLIAGLLLQLRALWFVKAGVVDAGFERAFPTRLLLLAVGAR